MVSERQKLRAHISEDSYTVEEACVAFWSAVYALTDSIIFGEDGDTIATYVHRVKHLHNAFRSKRDALAAQALTAWGDEQCQK